MRRLLQLILFFLFLTNILFGDKLDDELLKIQLKHKKSSLDTVDAYAKYTLTLDAIGTNIFETKKLFKLNKATDMIDLSLNYNKAIQKEVEAVSESFFKRWHKSMYKATGKKTMIGVLDALSENNDNFKKLKLSMNNNDLTIKKYTTIKKDINKVTDKYRSAQIIPKGLSILGLASSSYGLIKDIQSFKIDSSLDWTKGINSAYGVVDAAVGVSNAFNLKFSQTAFAKTLSSASLQKLNFTIALIQLEGVMLQALRDEQLNKIFNAKKDAFVRLEKDANYDINLLNQYLFDKNSKNLSFDGFFKINNLYINSIYKGIPKLKNLYNEKSNNINILQYNFNKNNFDELSQYERLYLMFLSIEHFYLDKAQSIVNDMIQLTKEGKSFSNIVLGTTTLGSGYEIFKDAGAIAIELSKHQIDLQRSMEHYFSTNFVHRFNHELYKTGKIIKEAIRRISQKHYDDEHALNNSYKKKQPYNIYMVSFDYNAENRVDKCISRENFYDGLNFIVTKDFKPLTGTALNNKKFENFALGENSDKKITIKEAVYFIDLYANNILNEINFDKRYKLYLLRPKGKSTLRKIYKQKWQVSYSNLGLDNYVKRQYIQMQGGAIAYTKNNMSNLNQCLIGYKALDLLHKYEQTMYYYYNLSREGK